MSQDHSKERTASQVTIEDVAAFAGVSRQTVSNVILVDLVDLDPLAEIPVLAPAALVAASGSTAAGPAASAPRQAQVRRITLYAEPLPDGQMGYGLEPGAAQIPGPLLELYEGEVGDVGLYPARREPPPQRWQSGMAGVVSPLPVALAIGPRFVARGQIAVFICGHANGRARRAG